MAEVKFQLGASADISTSSDVSAAAADVKDYFDRRMKANGRVATRVVLANQVSRLTPFGGGSVRILSSGAHSTPAVGRYWSLRSLALINNNDPTAITALSDTGVGLLAVGDPSSPTTADVMACVPSVQLATTGQVFFTPYATTFNDSSVIVPHGQSPYLVLPTTFYTSVPLLCEMRAEEYMEQSYLETHL